MSVAERRPSSPLTPLWRAIAVFRLAALIYVAALVLNNVSSYARPVLAWPVLAVMTAWTIFTTYAYADRTHRRPPLLTADLLVTMAVMAASFWVIGRPALQDGTSTLAVAWQTAPVLAWTVARGRRAGIVAALLMGATDLIVRARSNQATTGTVLMVLAAFAVGYLVRLTEESHARLQRAVELEAATRERERLARDIHDSVLQVLALVKRRGAGLDGEAGELARLAGEQEVALRALVVGPPSTSAHELDLMTLLAGHASTTVSVAAPAEAVLLPGNVARELAAAVAAALDNVVRHCAPGTKAWVLVEDEPDAVTVSVRDDGCGVEPARLAEAEAQGRLGVAQSIKGRLATLGGRVSYTSSADAGTEVELVVPRAQLR